MTNKLLIINGKNERAFLDLYHPEIKSVSEIGLEWSNLVDLHDYYHSMLQDLELIAQQFFLELRTIKGAYAVKYRVKDPEHLVDKAIRKKKEANRSITKENLLVEVDDIIGFRILHLFKNDMESIFSVIKEKFTFNEEPVVYHRKGDDSGFLERCKQLGIETREKEAGYRSIHCIPITSFLNQQIKIELQIRTVFEEAWSEIDHLVRYPNNTDNALLNNYLLLFNKLAGCADDMGTFLMSMRTSLDQYETDQNRQNELISSLRREIANLEGIKSEQTSKIDELMKKLDQDYKKNRLFSLEPQDPSYLDYISGIQNPSGLTYTHPLYDVSKFLDRYKDPNDILYNPYLAKLLDLNCGVKDKDN